jgi:hypothetical protein
MCYRRLKLTHRLFNCADPSCIGTGKTIPFKCTVVCFNEVFGEVLPAQTFTNMTRMDQTKDADAPRATWITWPTPTMDSSLCIPLAFWMMLRPEAHPKHHLHSVGQPRLTSMSQLGTRHDYLPLLNYILTYARYLNKACKLNAFLSKNWNQTMPDNTIGLGPVSDSSSRIGIQYKWTYNGKPCDINDSCTGVFNMFKIDNKCMLSQYSQWHQPLTQR